MFREDLKRALTGMMEVSFFLLDTRHDLRHPESELRTDVLGWISSVHEELASDEAIRLIDERLENLSRGKESNDIRRGARIRSIFDQEVRLVADFIERTGSRWRDALGQAEKISAGLLRWLRSHSMKALSMVKTLLTSLLDALKDALDELPWYLRGLIEMAKEGIEHVGSIFGGWKRATT